VAVSGAEGVESDGFGDVCGPIEIDSGMYGQSLTRKCRGLLDVKGEIDRFSFRAGEIGCLTV
jgi:hypothetical protein